MFEQVALSLPQEIYDEFRRALMTGKWSNGQALTAAHKKTCMETLFLVDAFTLPEHALIQ